MSVKINKDLRNIEKLSKNIMNIQPKILAAAVWLRGEILEQWDAGKGGDEKPMKKYSKSYKGKKANRGASATVNLLWNGLMRAGMIVVAKANGAAITFSGAQMDKARGNNEIRGNMMKVSDKLKNDTIKRVRKGIVP